MRRMKKFVAEQNQKFPKNILNAFCNTCIFIFQVILQLNCRSILGFELDKMKEEKNKLNELNKSQNLELQYLRYVLVRVGTKFDN